MTNMKCQNRTLYTRIQENKSLQYQRVQYPVAKQIQLFSSAISPYSFQPGQF